MVLQILGDKMITKNNKAPFKAPTEKQREYMSYLLKKCLPKNYETREIFKGTSYSWEEFERRHKIVDYLYNRKFGKKL